MYQSYTVKAGDTLYGISNQYGVSVTELARINNVTAQTLKVGQVLKIPTESGTNPDNMFMYTVKKGDSLYSIAKKYNTTVLAIKDISNLKSDNLAIGQVIRIPEIYTKPEDMYLVDYINYTVKRGDNLYTIARTYNINIDTIIQDNSLKNTNLAIGQNLKIRTNKALKEVEECFGNSYILNNSSNVNTYLVKKGDSLYSVAKSYNISVDTLKSLNNLTSNTLSVGQILKIPSDNTYTVKKGDSLYSIARKYNTTVDTIKKKNNLLNNTLSVGQILII